MEIERLQADWQEIVEAGKELGLELGRIETAATAFRSIVEVLGSLEKELVGKDPYRPEELFGAYSVIKGVKGKMKEIGEGVKNLPRYLRKPIEKVYELIGRYVKDYLQLIKKRVTPEHIDRLLRGEAERHRLSLGAIEEYASEVLPWYKRF